MDFTIYDRFRHKADMPIHCYNILLENSITTDNPEHINPYDHANTIISHPRGIWRLFYMRLHPPTKRKLDMHDVH